MVDIYDNLENYQDVGAEAKLLSENEALKCKLSESQAAYNALKKGIFQDFDKLYAQHEQLSSNFSSLLKTARAEIERKTNAITQLNIEKDQLVLQSLKHTTNKALLDRHNIQSRSKPKSIEFADKWRKCGTGDTLVLQSEPDHHRLKEQYSDRLPDGSKKVQEYPENQGNEEMLHDPRQKDVSSQETAQDIILSPGQGKENDYGHLKLTPGRIADRRKSMPVLRQQPKFSTDEEDDDVNSTGSHTYLPPIDEVDEGMKIHMKSGESSIQHNMRHGKLNPERDRFTRSRYGIEIDARNKPRGREKQRFEANYKSKRWEGERFKRNRHPSLGCQKEQNRSRSPPYDKYSRSKSRDRRSHYDKREPVFEYDRQKQTYHDSHYAKHNLLNIDEEPPYKRRKTERSIDEVKHNEQIRGQSRDTLTESSQSSRQSSLLRYEERTTRHKEDLHNKKEVVTTKLIAGQSKEMLLNQYSQHPKQPLLLSREQKSHRHIDEDNKEVMKSKQTRSQSKKVSVDSLLIPIQSSLLQHEDDTHKHFEEDHSRKSYEDKQTISHSSKQLSSLLTEDRAPVNIENKHYEVDNEARQTEQIREILAAESEQSSRKSSLWPESKAPREIEVSKCNLDDDNSRKNDAIKDNPPIFKATAGKLAINENPANEININTERPPSSMSMESGEIDDTDEYSPVSAASSLNSISVLKKAPTIQRRMSPRKLVNTKSYKKPEKQHRQISGKNNDHIQKKEDILIAHKIVPIEDLPDPCCVTSTYTIPKKNKDKSKEVLLSSVVIPKLDDRFSKHLKPQFSNKDNISNKKSSESTKPVSKISKSRSSKKSTEDRKEEIPKHHKKKSPSPAETSKPIKVLVKELPPKDNTNIKDKKSSSANTDSSTIQLVTQPSSKNSDESKHKKKDIAIEGKRKSKEKVQVSKSKGSIETVVKRKSKDAVEDDCQSNTDRKNNESMARNLTSKADVEGDLQLSDESTDSIDIYGGIIQDKVGVPEKTVPMYITKAQAQNHGVEQKADKSDSKGDDSKSKDMNAKLCELFGDSSSLVTLEDLIPTQNTERQGSAYMPSPSQAALMAQNEFWDRENATEQNNDHTKMQTRSSTRQRKDSDDKMTHKSNLNIGDMLKPAFNDNICESKEKDLEISEINVVERASKHVEVELPNLTDEVNRKEIHLISTPTADLPMLPIADVPLENIGTVEIPLSIHVPLQSCNEGYNEVIRVIPPPDEANEKDVYKTIVISTGTQLQCAKETVPVRIEDTGYDARSGPADASVVVKEPGPIGKNVATLMEALATSTPVRSQKVAEVIALLPQQLSVMHRNLPVLENIAHSPNTTDKTEVSFPQNSSDSSQTKTGGDVDVRIVVKRKRRFIR